MHRIMSTVTYKNMSFVIFDAPTDSNLPLYLEELQTRNVTDIFRVCDSTYNSATCAAAGVTVHDASFTDGSAPSSAVAKAFLTLCHDRFGSLGGSDTPSAHAIGVHCVAGLGRAPILVAIALVESGMSAIDAIEFVRQKRRGAFNSVQLAYLVNDYKPCFAHPVKKGFSFGFSKSASTGNVKSLAAVPAKKSPTPSLDGSGSPVSESYVSFEHVSEGNVAAPAPAKKGFKAWFSSKRAVV
ncbi:Protein tyrosine phosphatase type IVA 1 [Podochytrium sp. JEL0797]|nr:Protein tyrosine phosphatase type IVA 1 [Podochytrium sp. JEL0797]